VKNHAIKIMLSRVKSILKDYGYELYTRPYELNIVGLRSKSTKPNLFDDEIHVFYKKPDGKWNYHVYPATTDPGTFWLSNPSYPDGTAILAQGQFKNAYSIGKHRGQYDALLQKKSVTVIRDYDRDAFLDFKNGNKETGFFGINIHRAESKGTTKFINRYSAGCQVFQNVEDFEAFMKLCYRQSKLYGNSFTYTLIDFRAIRRITIKRVIEASTLVAALIFGWKVKTQKSHERT
jgi:hypothetical protein